jgi:hypothetical protein
MTHDTTPATTQLDLFGSTPCVDCESTPCVDTPDTPSALLRADLVGTLDAPEPVPTDKRLTGERQTQALLLWIHRFGWLTSRMVAALVFPTASQSWPLARRLLKRLLADKLILVRALPQGGDVYLLSVKGARLLHETTGARATSGQSLATGNALHRACGNWYLIRQVQAGLDIFTEHEIASGCAPFQTLNGKQFDGLVVHPPEDNGTRLVCAAEVENAWKNRQRRQATVDTATRHLGRDTLTRLGVDADGLDLYLARLAVVATTVDALRSMAATFQESHRLQIASESCLACVDVAVLPISPSLVAGDITTGNLWWDVVQPHSQG